MRVGNQSQLWSVAVVDVAVAYDADVAVASTIFERTAAEVVEQSDFAGDVLEAPQLLGVESASGDGVLLRMTIKTTPGDPVPPAALAPPVGQAGLRRRRHPRSAAAIRLAAGHRLTSPPASPCRSPTGAPVPDFAPVPHLVSLGRAPLP